MSINRMGDPARTTLRMAMMIPPRPARALRNAGGGTAWGRTDRSGLSASGGLGDHMSSLVPSCRSGPAETTLTSSSLHWILKGLPQASSVFEPASIDLSTSSCDTVGHSVPTRSPRHSWMAERTAGALVVVILIWASV